MRRAALLISVALLGVSMIMAQSTTTQAASPAAQSTSTQNTGTPPASSSATNPQSPATPNGSSAGESSHSSEAPSASVPSQGENPTVPSVPPGQTSSTTEIQPQAGATSNSDQNSPQLPAGSYPQQIPPAPMGADQVPANTEIHATLDTPLSSKTSKPGDRFTATIRDPVRGSNGAVIVPTGSRVEGEVSDAETGKMFAALRDKANLALRFRDIALPNGQTVPLTATLVSVNSTNGKNTKKADEEGQIQSGTHGKDVAKDVGIGAGIGTVAGLVFGSPLKGLAIGALAGGGYVLATKGKEVELPAETGMVIRLDQAINGAAANGQAPGQI